MSDPVSKGMRNERVLRQAEALYGNPSNTDDPPENREPGKMSDDIARNEKTAAQASALFGNPGGSPGESGNIDTALGAVFSQLEGKARGERNHTLAQEIAASRKALGKSMLAFGFSDGSAKEFSGLLSEYHGRPRDAKEAEANLDKALDELSTEWGESFSANLDGAKRVLAALTKGNSALKDFVYSTGLAGDVRLLRLAGEIAKHRKV